MLTGMKIRLFLTIAAVASTGGLALWMFLENSALREKLAEAEARTATGARSPQPRAQSGHPTAQSDKGQGAGGARNIAAQPDSKSRSLIPMRQPAAIQADEPAPALPFTVTGNPDGSVTLTDPATGKSFQTSVADMQRLTTEANAAVLAHTIGRPHGPSWTPGQAAGAPDTKEAGDYSTAWAPAAQDGGREWLQVKYDRAVELSEIVIHETYNPGAVSRVVAVLPGGGERVIWEGTASTEEGIVERALPVPPGIRSDQIRVELDTARVPGWNEIDAVEIIGRDGTRQWATESTASSYYGQSWSEKGRTGAASLEGELESLRIIR